MNDEIDRLNKENERQNTEKSPSDQSQWRSSDIPTNEDDKKRSLAEGIIQDLSNQRADIDVIKQTITEIGNQVNIITKALNQIVNGQGQPITPGATPQTAEQGKINIETLTAFGDLAEKAIAAYKNLKGTPESGPSFLDQNYINEQVKKSVMSNFEIGDALVSNLKSKLMNKAVTSSVSDALKDTHAPQ